MEIIGYGEDALTLMALRDEEIIKQILTQAGNKRKKSHERQIPKIKIYYRPSFGRNGKCLGECDAIIGTDTKIYFVECKWMDSKEIQSNSIHLDEKQKKRNDYLIEIAREYFSDDGNMSEKVKKDKNIKGDDTKLIVSLKHVFGVMKDGIENKKAKDVFRSLLVVFVDNKAFKVPQKIDGFKPIKIVIPEQKKIENSSFYKLD